VNLNNQNRVLILVIGDILAYLFSLILTLTVRYGEIPTRTLLISHLPSFSILFILFLIVIFSAGLYNKQSTFFRGKIQSLLLKAQIINIFVGIAFFYIAPVSITPKANLAIFFIISTAVLFLWRIVMFPVFGSSRAQPAILIGNNDDIQDLYDEVNSNMRYSLFFKDRVNSSQSHESLASLISEKLQLSKATIIVADLRDKSIESIMPFLYSQAFSGKQIIDASKLYEAIFDRIPLAMIGEKWFVENAGLAMGERRVFDFVKRFMDIMIALTLGIVSLLLYPFLCILIRLEDGGTAFIKQKRIGRRNKQIDIIKFRSMTSNDCGSYIANGGKTQLRVTRIGKFIRLMRLDELPQLWSVIKGDQSLIGPRPELPDLVKIYEKEIPYYHVRHLVKPGLSGWAQIYHHAHPHHAVAVGDTRDKLSYDLYYVKNRSPFLDIRIAFQTAKALLSRQGV
jgi:lipopolysaccharide/colanic/teichoic acid biosynthesis glycosyltransferase